jgi:nucleotide-binding universal stress UspA family protein
MRAVEHAARLAKHEKAELIALHVVPKPPFALSGDFRYGAADPADYYDEARRAAKKWLPLAEDAATKQHVAMRSEILVDAVSVLEAITEYAEHQKVDLIVTGTRGRSPSKRLLMGSVARGLVESAHCPVLVVR